MADVRQRTTFGNRFRFLLRVLGMTALLAAVAGAVVLSTFLPDLSGLTRDAAYDTVRETAESARAGSLGDLAHYAVVAAGVGAAVAVAWVVIELLGSLALAAGRNSAASSLNAFQVALAVALVVVVNVISFGQYKKWDLTRDKEFTLAADQATQLGELRTDAPTTVVVLQLHKTAGTLSDKPDAIDYAAERKVVEKVRDVVDQLREFGPQFNVAVLDVEDEGYERKLRALTKRRPGLAEAITDAPENSIFFYADGKVRKEPRAVADKLASGTPRPAVGPDPDDSGMSLVYPANVTRMSFTEFYQLDKTASREATTAEREAAAVLAGGPAFAPGVTGKGNLVLIPQGKDAFVRKVLALEERRPKVALAVIHPLLSSRENFDEYSAAGLRKALEANGYDVVDVILKKWGRGGPNPAAYTYEESELDRVENRYNLFTLLAADRELVISQLKIVLDRIEKASYAELNRQFGRQLSRPIRSEEDRATLKRLFELNVTRFQEELDEVQKQLAEVAPQYRALAGDERAAENRRLTDIKAKLKQYVDDCDLLIVPRLTTLDVAKGEIIPPNLFNLAKEQAEAVKEFVAAGKPVLFAMGPTNVDRRGGPGSDAAGDDVESLLPRLGVELGRQTIITETEAQAMAERQSDALGSTADVPPLQFDLPGPDGKSANPVGSAFLTTARAVDRKLDVKKSGYRPVYVAPGFAEHLTFAPEFMFTGRDSWNESNPISDDDSIPRFEPTKPDDPKKGTRDEERRGPFPVGLALEVPVPAEWLRTDGFADQQKVAGLLPLFDGGLNAALLTVAADAKTPRPRVRLVVVGHGGMFTGKKLDPANESLLMHAVDWQLKRADRLPKEAADADKWRYPRVALDDRQLTLWRYGAVLGLPLLCGFLGTVVLMARKVR